MNDWSTTIRKNLAAHGSVPSRVKEYQAILDLARHLELDTSDWGLREWEQFGKEHPNAVEEIDEIRYCI